MISALSHCPLSSSSRGTCCGVWTLPLHYRPSVPSFLCPPLSRRTCGDYFIMASITFSKTINNPLPSSPRRGEFCGKLSSHCPLMGEIQFTFRWALSAKWDGQDVHFAAAANAFISCPAVSIDRNILLYVLSSNITLRDELFRSEEIITKNKTVFLK